MILLMFVILFYRIISSAVRLVDSQIRDYAR
jgi:hypothetical protein